MSQITNKPFANWDYDDAANAVGQKAIIPKRGSRFFALPSILAHLSSEDESQPRRTETALRATEFYGGNHWQHSSGFVGQLPPIGLERRFEILQAIKEGFISENVIKEVIKTHVGGILGREPVWSFLKAEGETDRGNKSSFENRTGETLTRWWNDRKGLKDLQKAARILTCEGRVVRRLFFPRGRLNNGIATASNLADALKLIYFHTVYADEGGVFTNPDTQQDIGVFLFDEFDNDGKVTGRNAELSFLNDNGQTVSRVVTDKGGTDDAGPYELGGRLLIYELTRDALITEQIQSNQRALNLAHTMMMRNVNMAGSRERHVTNAMPPVGERKIDTEGNIKQRSGTFKTGAGATNFIMGVPIYGDDGTTIKGYTSPNVTLADPASVEVFKETIDKEKEAIYSQAHQRHVLIVDKADTSGRAREVARREFERSLKETKTELDACGRWQLETTLWMAAGIINESSRYLNLRADFNCLIDAGDPDPEKQKAAILLRQPGGPKNRPLISDETARNLAGIEDAAAELAKIEQEEKLPEAKLPEGLKPISGQQTPKVAVTPTTTPTTTDTVQ